MFDLSSVLKDVSNLETGNDNGRDRIEYIALDLIDPDERNFYSLDGLEELASNIELLGLQQPIRVRPGEDGHYIVVSGHRRRAACMLIASGGSEQFSAGVPCIVERGDVSAELQELRLIYANSSTRVLSSAEISRQAERVTDLLYKLKEQGYEFPGRMRDHVAEACNVSKSKLARLNAIRSNLCAGFLKQFDEGILSEAAAYELQKLPADIQEQLASEKWLAKRRGINASCAENVSEFLDKTHNAPKCPGGSECSQPTIERLKFMAYAQYSWKTCDGGCCLFCHDRAECSYRCEKCKERDKQSAKDEKQKKAQEKTREEQLQIERRAKIQAECRRFLPLIEAAGLGEKEKIQKSAEWDYITRETVRSYASGEFGDKRFYSDRAVVPDGVVSIKRLADQLHCSADFICGLTDDPTPANERVSRMNTEPGWTTDRNPEESGEYLVWYGKGYREVFYWDGDLVCWTSWKGSGDVIFEVHGWTLVPKMPEVKA